MKASAGLKRIAIIGSGPSGLFLLKKLVESGETQLTIDMFEAGETTGKGFPYSPEGASNEHITNVSGNEIPNLVTGTRDWIKTLPPATLEQYGIDLSHFNDYHVFPRLLFGEYLQAQFGLLVEKARAKKIDLTIHLNTRVKDISDDKQKGLTKVVVDGKPFAFFNHVIICTGHQWPVQDEGKQPGWYDSPYPPAKIARGFDHPVAVKGSSLTAIDALRTIARQNGQFSKGKNDKTIFTIGEKSANFRIDMYSLKGLLPGVRFHLEDSHLSGESLLSEDALDCHRRENDGFVSLDFVFEKDFKEPLREKDPVFYDHIRDMTMEAFVEEMMTMREKADPFQLLKAEYEEARISIQRRESVQWKEMLAMLSFAMNYPAKYFSAEDMQRLQKGLMPLISVIIAFVPQDSCEEMLALHAADRLTIIPVEKDSRAVAGPERGAVYHYTNENGKDISTSYETYINCTGQPHLWVKDFPFKTLVEQGTVSQALLRFRSVQEAKKERKENKKIIESADQKYYLQVPGLAITDCFQVIGKDQLPNPRLYIMAVPFIGGYNPDYSGLDFCEEASGKIVKDIFTKNDH